LIWLPPVAPAGEVAVRFVGGVGAWVSLKVTVMVVFPVMVKVQVVAVLVHPPLKLATVDPALAVAVRVTDVPEVKEAEQVDPQLIAELIPAEEVTVPAPVPDLFTVKTGFAAVVALAVLE